MMSHTTADASGGVTAATGEPAVLRQSDMTFIVTPPQIVFKGFAEHGRYEAKLQFKNQTTSTQYIRLMRPEGRFFSISEPRGGNDTLKVAAGLTVTYSVYFTPEKDSDYECDLVAFTDHERFVVPVRAIGSRGTLTLPPLVKFDASPIRSTSRNIILITNTGTKPCDWRAAASAPFAITPSCGLLPPSGTQQVVIEFCPQQLMLYESFIVFDLGRGETQSMKVAGTCVNVDIALESDTLIIPKTFISLERQGVISVYNRSDDSVEFAWKEHATESEEAEARACKIELTAHSQQRLHSTGKGMTVAATAAAQRLLQSKLEAVECQPLFFDDDVFTIEPLFGSIPARGKREFTVTFNPQLAMAYVATAFLDVQGKSQRQPLTIKGVGLGPHCALGFDNLDLGDIFINSQHQYEVVLENRGSIEAKWMLQPQSTLFGPKFRFSPSNGIIQVGATQLIGITFCSDIIGIVSETFLLHVQGSKDELELHFKGRVIGPTFHFDTEELDFGNVSYNFWHTKNFNIVNTSEIPMKFTLRVPEDHPTRREFEVVPPTGMILPHGKQKIQMDFLSNTVQEYNAHLVVDIDEVGENLDSLPIKATCIVPDIAVSRETLDYGSCFIGFPYSQEVELRNETALSAKFEVILPAEDDPIRKKADIMIGGGEDKEKRGIVAARSTQRIAITMTAKTTGSIHIPLYIRILGAETAPHLVALSAKVTGPKIDVQPRTLDFGTLDVLTDHSKPVVIVNNSPISAVFSAKLTAKHSPNVIPPFSLKVAEGTIKANGSAPLHINAFLDEAMRFEDELIITVQHNQGTESVQLLARGKGFALIPSIPLDVVDFEDLFTTVTYCKTFVLQNRGRRPQQVQWSNERGKIKEGDPPVVFTITPERAELKGKSEETFTIEGMSSNKGVFMEKFVLKQNQTHKVILRSTVQGSFQPPLLTYSATSLPFVYTYQGRTDAGPAGYMFTKPLTMKNVTPLSLDFSLKINKANSSNEPGAGGNPSAVPFTIDKSEFSLKKGESAVVNVMFDASYRGDRTSHSTRAKMTISFANHAQKDNINLSADIQFPNLILDNTTVDFGCILNDTEHRKTLTMTNPSTIPAAYTWVFEEEAAPPGSETSARRNANKSQSVVDPSVPINNVFDVVPFRGVIAPGGSETVEVIYNGIPGRRFTATAVCQVEGGPDYGVNILGEASSIHYKFDKVTLDFESQDFDKWEEKEIIVSNAGRVPFPFQVDLSILSRPGMVEVVPMSGVIVDKVKLTVRFCPRVPDNINDNFRVNVAHFEPQIINVKGHGSYSALLVSAVGAGNFVSREESTGFSAYYRDAKTRMADPNFRPFTQVTGRPSDGVVIDPAAIEAERLLFRDTIIDDMLLSRAVAMGEAPEPPPERTALVRRKIGNGDPKYILARYIVDIGSVIKGDSKKKSFRLTNTSPNTVLFSVDRRALANTAVTLTPDKFSKLPVYGNQVVEVSVSTKNKSVAIGPYSQEIIFEIKGGPLVLVTVIANVVLPQLKVSTERLDFRTVLVGMTRIMPVMIENNQSLPCEWQAQFPDDNKRRGTADRHGPNSNNSTGGTFVCKPDRGVLMPNQQTIIEVSFSPSSSESVSQRFLLRINSNPKSVEILCTGVGEELNVVCEPQVLELPPVFPFHTTRRNFKLSNFSSVPVEMFSYDFDEKYLIEEEILRNAQECFVNDVLLLPPREVGSSLPDNLMEAYYNKLVANDRKYAELDYVPVDEHAEQQAAAEERATLQSTTLASSPVPLIDVRPEETEQLRSTLILFMGPELSGKTTHSNRLVSTHGFTALSLDDVIGMAVENDSPEGAAFRSVWTRQLFPPSSQEVNASPPPSSAKGEKMSKAEQIKAAQAAAEAAAKAEVNAATLARALAARLRQHDLLLTGVVMDDLKCCLTSNVETLLTAVKEAVSLTGYTLLVIDLSIDAMLTELRRATDTMNSARARALASVVRPISDEEYDRLPTTAKRQHDYALKRQRDAKKALAAATQSMEEILKAREEKAVQKELLTIQEEVERDIAIAKEQEDPKAAKKAAKRPTKEADIPPPINWEELSGPERFRRIYELLRTLFEESSHRIIRTDGAADDVFGAVLNSCSLMPTAEEGPNTSVMTNTNHATNNNNSNSSNVNNPRTSAAPTPTLINQSMGSTVSGATRNNNTLTVPTRSAEVALPAPITLQRIERPKEKRQVKPIKYFKILTPVVREAAPPPDTKVKEAKKGSKTAAQPVTPQEALEERTRWIIAPGASIDLTVQFCCDDVSPHAANLALGIVGTAQEITLQCSTASSYPDIIRDLRLIFPTTRKKPSGEKYPSKVFLTNQKRYEFGPLLVPPSQGTSSGPSNSPSKAGKGSKDKEKVQDLSVFKHPNATNTETLKFTNSGAFPATITFMFENNHDKAFMVQSDTLTLGVGQSGEVNVVAMPDSVGEFKNSIVACIKDNPEPLKLDFSCRGTRPTITLNGKKELAVEFGRLLVRKQEERKVILRNDALLPARWRLTGTDRLPPEITFDVLNGMIDPEKETTINIRFLSERTNSFNIPLKMEVLDADSATLYETLPLVVKGEAHDVIIEWTREVDFKTIRVGDIKKEVIRVLNKGPYEIGFAFKMTPKMAEVLTITPMEGTIRGMQGFKDAAVCNVEAVFKSLTREVNITPKRFGDVELHILDPTTKKLVGPPQNIVIRGEALHHRYSIKPQQLNFGPCMYRQRKTSTFEITNSGVFEIKYRLYNYKDGIAKALEAPTEPEPKKKSAEKKGKKGQEPEPAELILGAFSVSPSLASIAPGTTAIITVAITPEGNALFNETLGIYIEDVSTPVNPQGIPFEIEAESCVPGIIADLDNPDSDSVFEEQQIVPRLDAFRKVGHVYSREDRCFSFGLTLSGRKQQERLRLTNPTKVPTTVLVRIAPRGDAPDARAAAEVFDVAEAKVNNGKLLIPPHEHRYVTIGFAPTSLNAYSAFFEATVENGLDPKTKQLKLELRGEGSLPTVVVDIPPPPLKPIDLSQTTDTKPTKGNKTNTKASKNQPPDDKEVFPNTLVLQRTIVGTTSSRPITVRNAGDLPATIRFSLPAATLGRGISFPHRNEDFTLLPGAVEKYSVFFEPVAIGTFTAKLLMAVQDNRYEDLTIHVSAEGYFEPATFGDIDENTENRLSLGDCYVNVPKTKNFKLMSHGEYGLRFSWMCANRGITITPSAGHLPAGTSRTITVAYNGTAPTTDIARCTCALEALSEENGPVVPWDSNMKTSKWVPEPSSAPIADEKEKDKVEKAASINQNSSQISRMQHRRSRLSIIRDEDAEEAALAALKRPMKRVQEPVPEPAYTVMNTLPNKDLYVTFACDHTMWEMTLAEDFPPPPPVTGKEAKEHAKGAAANVPNSSDANSSGIIGPAKSLSFAQTKILQKRLTPILVRNSGKVVLPYSMTITSTDPDTPLDTEMLGTFSVEPASGEIAPGQVQPLTVRYIPRNVGQHKQMLIASFPHSAKPEVQIPLSGSADCPLVHFDLPQSDYYQARRTDKPPIDPGVAVIEFFSKGVMIRNTVRFMAVNPSNMSYDFEWVDKSKIPLFKCTTMRGTIHSGKKYEMVFEFFPESLETFESDWVFTIPQHNTTVPFLLIGGAAEPELFFTKSKVDFGHVIVGARGKTTVAIENRESVPYPFTFDTMSGTPAITFAPMSGVIPPNGSLPIEITFAPTTEEPYNSTLTCIVKKALSPLTCNVKGEGYMTHDTLKAQEPNGTFATLSATVPNVIQLPTTQVNGNVVKKFVMSNQGRYNLDYKWTVAPNPHVTLSQLMGTVLPGGSSNVDVTYAPTREGRLVDYKMVCKVTNGSTYTVMLNAIAANPNVTFSWENFDFGPRFLFSASHEPASTVLTVTNKDKMTVSVDAVFDNKDYMELDVSSFVLNAGEKRDVRVTFYPRECIQYHEAITFTLNELTRTTVTVTGEGTVPKIECSTKTVRFGPTQVMEKREVEVRVQCRSKIPTLFSLEGCIPTELARIGVSVSNDSAVWLKPKETRVIVFTFRPTARMRAFNYDLMMLVLGKEQPFVSVGGMCLGAEVHLDCKTVSFGSVVVGTRVMRRITILNSGDTSLDFNWNERKLGNDFSVTPVSGVAPAHDEVRCELVYAPLEANRDGKKELEVRFSEVGAVPLLVTGTNSVDRPPLTDILNFHCRVRETATQKVVIKNDTQETWTLRPVISNTFWSAPETVVVRSRDSAEIPILYTPTISTKNRPDQANDAGTLFIALPTGNAYLYRLDGVADAPAVSAPPIEREFTAKVPHTERLTVSNWLGVAQKFTVTQNWSHDLKDESVSIKGVPTIDVPANSTRDYKLTFSSMKEGKFNGTINFVNDITKEYQFYNVVFNVKPAKEAGVIELRTPCRVRATKIVSISNPLSKPVTLVTKVENPELQAPSTVQVLPKTEAKINVEFFPLLVKEYPPSKLIFSCNELGEFPYTVHLSSVPAPPEKPLRLNCALGQCVSTTLRFQHYSKTATEFSFKFQDPKQTAFFKSATGAIKVNAAADPKAGAEVAIDVTFEPPRIGEFKELVELSSNAAGSYVFTLQGVCTAPQRQGPIEIRPNQSTTIPFKNIFNENVNFTFSTDDPQFIVAKASEMLPSKKSTSIVVQYKCDDSNTMARGKLTVMGTPSTESTGGPISWVYYLRGMKEGEVPTQPPPPPTKGKNK